MTEHTPPDDASATRRSDWWEVAAVVILGLATLASAWSGYQAARWGGEETKENRAANVARVDATRNADLASRQTLIDVTVFAMWLEAATADDQRLRAEIETRFRADFRPAFDAWVGQAAPDVIPAGTPFDLAGFRLPVLDEVDRLLHDAGRHAAEADAAGQTGDNYVLTAVLYASVLFLAGVASKVPSRRASHLAVMLAGSLFVGATAVMLSLPISVEF